MSTHHEELVKLSAQLQDKKEVYNPKQFLTYILLQEACKDMDTLINMIMNHVTLARLNGDRQELARIYNSLRLIEHVLNST